MTLSQFGHALRPRHARNATGGARANATTKRAQPGQNNRSLHDLQGVGLGVYRSLYSRKMTTWALRK